MFDGLCVEGALMSEVVDTCVMELWFKPSSSKCCEQAQEGLHLSDCCLQFLCKFLEGVFVDEAKRSGEFLFRFYYNSDIVVILLNCRLTTLIPHLKTELSNSFFLSFFLFLTNQWQQSSIV
ncbi:hypothetical protein FOCC_FOCC016500 [Frankliniella occidentalis]|nr:hypothetical protein FOCC_FOCC016500 [Frankliniella occidentalis]